MTWRVTHHREDSPHPAYSYHYGDKAEAEARGRADELRRQPNVNRVEVDGLERRRRGEGGPVFSLESLSQLRPTGSARKCATEGSSGDPEGP